MPAVTANFEKLRNTAGSLPFNSNSKYLYNLSNSCGESPAFSGFGKAEYVLLK